MLSEPYSKDIAKKSEAEPDSNQPGVYEIRVRSHLRSDWTDWFEGLTITREENGDTLLTGPVVDQAALYGLLKKIRDLGMPLVSVNCVKPGESNLSEAHEQKSK